jgi:hypothetical protein
VKHSTATIRYGYAILPMIACRRNLHGNNHTNFTKKADLHGALQGLFVKLVCVRDIRVQILAVLLVELGGVSLWSHHDTVVLAEAAGDISVGVPVVVPVFAVDQVAE